MPPSAYQGSSPRVRGAALAGLRVLPAVGIIPARAGSRGRAPRTRRSTRDHPHVCGEQAPPRWRSRGSSGSSPRVRGADYDALEKHPFDGIIPARAGSSLMEWKMSCLGWDHPRACGEQLHGPEPSLIISGSSPRVRGAAPAPPDALQVQGIIPARAGSSWRQYIPD